MSDQLDREESVEQEQTQTEFVFDPDNTTPVIHRWIDRGLKLSCEEAGHPYHQVWKRQGVKPIIK